MRFTLNNQTVSVPDDLKEARLLWVLRDHFNLIGPKFGCGIGECGACSVHVNGEAIRSCSITLEDVKDQSVVTLEGLAPKGELHPVQAAWIEGNVPQCGYCQNGQIMTAAALLNNNPGSSAEEIEEVMDGVRCRCGTQSRIKTAVHKAQLSMRKEA